jgi:hypothetical protein
LTADELLPRLKGLVVASLKLEGVAATSRSNASSALPSRPR